MRKYFEKKTKKVNYIRVQIISIQEDDYGFIYYSNFNDSLQIMKMYKEETSSK